MLAEWMAAWQGQWAVDGYTQKEDANHNLLSVAFIYNSDFGGSITDLNNITLDGGQTATSLGWTLTKAQAINDAGVIVGYGVLNGRNTAWILYPKCQD